MTRNHNLSFTLQNLKERVRQQAHLSASRTKNEATEAWKVLRRVLTHVTRGPRTCLGFVEPTIAKSIYGTQNSKWEHSLDGMRQ